MSLRSICMWVVVEHGKEIQLQVVGGVGHLRRQLGGGKAHRSALSRLLCGEDYHIAETVWELEKKPRPTASSTSHSSRRWTCVCGAIFPLRFSPTSLHKFSYTCLGLRVRSALCSRQGDVARRCHEKLQQSEARESRDESHAASQTAQTFRIAEITFSLD